MWAYEHSIETSVDADRIWRLWEDVAGWGAWNADIEHVELAGPFADRSGGAYVLRADSLEQARALVAADPLAASGSALVDVREWTAA